MSTRAIYTFKDLEGDTFTVFKHYDGYPTAMGAYKFIQNALSYAWKLPRFEADEFSAAFIAANKSQAGDLRLLDSQSTNGDVLGIEFHYVIEPDGNRLKVMVHDLWNSSKIYPVYITATGIVEPIETLVA